MKFSYSLLKTFVPDLPKKGEFLEILNHMVCEAEDCGDDTLDLSLPPNRFCDLSSHLGVAEEVARVTGVTFKKPKCQEYKKDEWEGVLEVRIEDSRRSPRYIGKVFSVPEHGRATPKWMVEHLEACGIRPLGLIVDIMNYVMLETGQPLHAFDAAHVAKNKKGLWEIIVRQASEGEVLKTIDEETRVLSKDDLVIADTARVLALAGIKGGKLSEVHEGTSIIIVEAASFGQEGIFRSAKRLGLLTDAAQRFGHGISSELPAIGIARATELLEELAEAVYQGGCDAYPKPQSREIIGLSLARISSYLGRIIDKGRVCEILLAMDCEVKERGEEELLVTIPLLRTDLAIQEDLIEEIARIEGYDKLESRPTIAPIIAPQTYDAIRLKDTMRDFAVAAGYDEIYSHSLEPKKESKEGEPGQISLANPLSAEYAALRTDLRVGVARALELNTQYFEDVRVFEIGNVFTGSIERVLEQSRFALGLVSKDKTGILELKGALGELFARLGITEWSMPEHAHGTLLVEVGEALAGTITSIHLKKGWHGAIAELDLAPLLEEVQWEHEFSPLPKYPSIERDISVVIPESVRVGEVLKCIQDASPALAKNVDCIDLYEGRETQGETSLTFRIVLQADDRTLTDSEANAVIVDIVEALETKGWEVRK